MQKIKQTMLLNPEQHFLFLLIDDCMDGGETTTRSCFASPQKRTKVKFDLFYCHKAQQDHFGTKN